MTTASYNCPVEVTVEAIGGKWKCVILWWLRRDGKRFGELMQLIPGVSSKVLTQQLRELETDGLIHRQTYREAPPRVEYSLTAYGETLRSLVELMCEWGKAREPEYEFGSMRLAGIVVLIAVSNGNEQNRLRAILENRSAQILVAESIDEALDRIGLQPHLLLVDLENFQQQGLDLIRQIRSLPADRGGDIPAVALTNDAASRIQALREGFQVHLLKPFEPVELIATLASVARQLKP